MLQLQQQRRHAMTGRRRIALLLGMRSRSCPLQLRTRLKPRYDRDSLCFSVYFIVFDLGATVHDVVLGHHSR